MSNSSINLGDPNVMQVLLDKSEHTNTSRKINVATLTTMTKSTLKAMTEMMRAKSNPKEARALLRMQERSLATKLGKKK